MAQFARPNGDVTNTGTGGFANIDESTPSDADFWYGPNATAAELEVALTDVTDPQSSVGHTFRYRIAKVNAGVLDGAGNAVTVTARLMQGATQIATDVARTATATWTQYSYTLSGAEADAITDPTDLRLEFLTSNSGGSPANRRGGAVSWAEFEVPDAPAGVAYTDANTAYLKLTASAVEAREVVDAETVGLVLTASATEAQELIEAVTAYLTLTPSGTEEHTVPSTGALLLVVGDANAPVTADTLVKTWLEDIGYSVTYVSDETAENVTGYDGVVISESISAATLASKYANAAIPVVLHEGDSQQVVTAFKLAGTGGTSIVTTDSVEVIEPTHPIADGPYGTFSGTEVLSNSTAAANWANLVDVATGGVKVAHAAGSNVRHIFVAFESGAALTSGNAPARRAFAGVRSNGIPQLNADGIAMVKNTYAWAFGEVGPIEHLDSATVTLTLTPSAVESRERVDAQTVGLTLTASATESREVTDAATARINLTPSATEQKEIADAVTAYLTLTPAGIEDYTPGVVEQILRPNGDVTANNWTTAPLFSKINDDSDATGIIGVAV